MILNNREDWNNGSDEEREAVIKELMEGALKDNFAYEGMETFACAGIKNRIAVFRHLPTEMLFHLIPGELNYKVGLSKELLRKVKAKYLMDLEEESEKVIKITPFLMSKYLITEKAWYSFEGDELHKNNEAICREFFRQMHFSI